MRVIYLKAEQDIESDKKTLQVSDLCKITGQDKKLCAQVGKIQILDLTGMTQKRTAVSMMKIIELIQMHYPDVEIVSLGENDILVEIISPKHKKERFTLGKIIFVCCICFFGTAFSIMAFHNDIEILNLSKMVYESVGLVRNGQVGILEIGYSLGLAGGIILFYNHIGKRKLTSDPTPIEVEMRIYENEVNAALLEDAKRLREEQDVE